MKFNSFFLITIWALLASVLGLGCNMLFLRSAPKSRPAFTISDETLRKCYLSLWDDTTDTKQVSENLITIIIAKPVAGVAYYSACSAPSARFIKSRSITKKSPQDLERQWLRDWQNIVRREQGDRKIASQIILACSNILIRGMEMERQWLLSTPPMDNSHSHKQKAEAEGAGKENYQQAMRIYGNILKNRHARDFHPLCRILRLQALMDNTYAKPEKGYIDRELAELEKVDSDYKLIVEEFKLDQQLRNGNVSNDLALDIWAKKFELYMAQPIGSIKLWENPIPIVGAFEIAMTTLSPTEKLQKIQRLLPLLNDNNDPPSPGPEIRTEFYSELVRLFMEQGEKTQAKAYAQKALLIVADKKKRESFEATIKGH